MKRVSIVICFLASALLWAPPAYATLVTLTSDNSTLTVDPASQSGAYGWTIDGTNILYQQWFWYRIGNTAEKSIDTLPLLSESSTPTTLSVTYGNDTHFTIGITYSLTGGQANTNTSDVREIVNIQNKPGSTLDFHFFQYSDFNLNGMTSPDSILIDKTASGKHDSALQWSDGGPIISESSVSRSADEAEANYIANSLDKLNHGLPTTLNSILAAWAGDVTWAFEWDEVLGGHDSLLISKKKNAYPNVPEPAAIGLLGGVLVLLGRKLRRQIA